MFDLTSVREFKDYDNVLNYSRCLFYFDKKSVYNEEDKKDNDGMEEQADTESFRVDPGKYNEEVVMDIIYMAIYISTCHTHIFM